MVQKLDFEIECFQNLYIDSEGVWYLQIVMITYYEMCVKIILWPGRDSKESKEANKFVFILMVIIMQNMIFQ